MTASPDAPTLFTKQWSSIRLRDSEPIRWHVDTLSLFAQRIRNDLMLTQSNEEPIALKPSQDPLETIDYLPLGLNWKRWALDAKSDELRIWPTLPDRPLVVKTRTPVIVPAKSIVSLYINIPVWIEVSVARDDGYMPLETICPDRLSNTWYGSHFEGELCYALKSRARRAIEDLTEEPLRAVCHFSIHNKSEEALPVEKMRVLPDHLPIYKTKDRLWSDTIKVEFLGKLEPSRITYGEELPEEAKKAQKLREAKTTDRSGSFLDFHVFRNLLHSV